MLQKKINDDVKQAMKSKEEIRLTTLRMLLASLHNKEIEKKGKKLEPTLSEEEVIEVLSREAKKRRESIDAYTKGARDDLVKKESEELKIIKSYLPEQLSEEEVEKIVIEAIKRIDAKGQKDFGRVMGEAIKELKGKAEASLISEIIKHKLPQ